MIRTTLVPYAHLAGPRGDVPVTIANLAGQCAQTVLETLPQIMRAIHEEMRRHGAPLLSPPQLRTLAFLHRNPGSCLFRVAEHLGVTRPTASVIVERLVRRGMVTRAANPQERRRIVLDLTSTGAWHLQRARQATQTWMAAALSRLSPASLRRIKEGMGLLAQPFAGSDGDRRGDRPRPRGPRPPSGPLPKAPHLNARLATGRGDRAGLSGQ